MFGLQDIKERTIFQINSLDKLKFHIEMGNIVISDKESGEVKTKLCCTKVFALVIIGGYTITTPTLEKCSQFGIQLVCVKTNFKPFFVFGNFAESNYLLRYRQYHVENALEIATVIQLNKMENQIQNLKLIRKKSDLQSQRIERCQSLLTQLNRGLQLSELMGIEGNVAKNYFTAYFEEFEWKGRKPRAKQDYVNSILDIGYTYLFNIVETFSRLFGFDIYMGFCHQTWYRRKSLICDLVEPFRVIIDAKVVKCIHLNQFQKEHFIEKHGQYFLKYEYQTQYSKIFLEELVEHKIEIFTYIREFYRAFMGQKSLENFPIYNYCEGIIEYVGGKL